MRNEDILILILTCAILSHTHVVFAQAEYVEEFGITEGERIDKGVVFIDGEYLPSPYVVSRRGLSLYVNSREVRRPRRHIQTPILTGNADLSRLSDEERQRLFRALEATRGIYEKYLSRGYGYLFSSKGGHIKLSLYTVAYKLPKVIELLGSDTSRDEKLKKLYCHNWHLRIDVEPLIDNFTPSSQLISRLSQQAQELLRVEEFGTGAPVSLNEGFVFLNGRYLEMPYMLQRRGLALFLNGEMIDNPVRWPMAKSLGDVDPSLPPEFDAETSWFDEPVRRYLARKQAYLCNRYASEQASKLMEKAIISLPFVTDTRRDQDWADVLHVTTTEGLTIPIALVVFRRTTKYDHDSVLRSVEERLEMFQRSLQRGSCYVLSRNRGWTCLPVSTLHQTLCPLVEILRSGRSQAVKRDDVRRLGIAVKDTALAELVGNFIESPQLTDRLERLKTGTSAQ